jgi:5-dehydro-4-deoxyglucarate dehydratase
MPKTEGRCHVAAEEVRPCLTGPVASVSTPFSRDGGVDFAGLRSFIDFVIAGGTKTVLLTYGDSLYTLLTDDEIAAVTRATAEHTSGRALVVAACGGWATPKAVEFAGYCRELGADLLMLKPPNWAMSATVETLTAHYRTVSEHIPVMIVTNVFADWPPARAMEVLEALQDTAPNVVAVKDDLCGDFARRLGLTCHERMAIISGGQKQNHLNALPYGCDGYLSTFTTFKPEIAQSYWSAISAGDLPSAVAVIRDYDLPLFDYIGGLPGGFDAGVHGTLELFGIAQRWRRSPYYSLSDQEMAHLADFYRALGLL